MRMHGLFLALFTAALIASGDEAKPAAAEIMHRVAENQDREQAARNQFVYEQKVHRVERSKAGKLLREEFWTYEMTPGAKETHRKVASVKGRYWRKGAYRAFEGEPVPNGLLSITFDDDNGDTRDGVDSELFPLTTKEQQKYTFQVTGERMIQGRPAYRIEFRPTDRKDYGWVGEALVDEEEFQLVSAYTRLSRKLPVAVRTVLGTDVPGLGFNITYKRVDKDLWFPATYGTEFSLRALFFLNRTFSESGENTNFRRTAVDSKIAFEGSADQ